MSRFLRSHRLRMRLNYLFAILTLGGVAIAGPIAKEAG